MDLYCLKGLIALISLLNGKTVMVPVTSSHATDDSHCTVCCHYYSTTIYIYVCDSVCVTLCVCVYGIYGLLKLEPTVDGHYSNFVNVRKYKLMFSCVLM